jgi:hypothetical protein
MKKDRSAGVLQPGRAPHGRRSDGRARGGALAAALALGASGGLQAADTTPSAADGGGTVARADVGAAPLGTGLLSRCW